MRAMYRTITAVALGLPLLLVGPAMANASGYGACDSKEHHKANVDIDQNISQTANQNNSNGPTTVSGKDSKAVNVQENESGQSATQTASAGK